LRNSGVKTFFTASSPSVLLSCSVKPIERTAEHLGTAFVVMISTVLRKSALRPCCRELTVVHDLQQHC